MDPDDVTTTGPKRDAETRSAADDSKDRALAVAMWALVALVGAFAAYFAWTVWADRQAELASTPAGRTVLELKAKVKQDPNNVSLRVRLGEALAAAGLYDQAVDQFNQALKADEENLGAFLDLGIVAMQREEYSTAEGYFQRVVDLTEGAEFQGIDSRREQALFYLGETALIDKRYEEAVSFFKAALRIRKDASDTYLELAMAYKGFDQNELAKEQLQIALDFDPSYAQAHYELGTLLLEEGDEVGAALHLGKAAQLAPNSEEAAQAVEQLGPADRRLEAARKLLASGDLEDALVEARVAYGLDPQSFDAAVLTAEVLEKLGEAKQALSIYREAATLASGEQTVGAQIARLSGATK